jgi:GH35 family endo-1,4-beta-xylanase
MPTRQPTKSMVISLMLLTILSLLFSCRTVNSTTTIFNLEDHITNGTFDLRHPLQDSGNPQFSVVNGGLLLSNRSANWHALDLLRDFPSSPLQIGDKVTIRGTAIDAPAGTNMILGGGESPWNWMSNVEVEGTQEFTIQVTLTEQHFTEDQFVRLRLQTNDAGATMDFIVSQWTVTRDGATRAQPRPTETNNQMPQANQDSQANLVLAEGEPVLIYSLDTDPYLQANQGPTDLSQATNLARSGDPTIRVTGTTLELTNRGQNWHTVDVLFEPLGLEMGGTYEFVAQGTAPAGTEIGWHRSEAPWTYVHGLTRTDGAGNWEISTRITYPAIPQMPGLRIQTNGAPDVDLKITSINVYRIPVESHDPTAFALPQWDLSLPSLQELFAPYFFVGNIYSTTPIMNQFDTRQAFRHHFNAVTAENWHKPDQIAGPGSRSARPAPEDFNFTQADAIIDWAIENNITLIGHALIWHSQSPNWLFRNPQNQPLTRAEALSNMEFYISTLANHWQSRGVIDSFYSWDVTNEVIASSGGNWGGDVNDWNAGDWRTQMRTESGWWQAFSNGYDASAGEHPSDFVFYAYYFARRYFPNSILYYNDYNEEIPAKRNAIAQMVEQINQRWQNHPEYDGRLLIERIGMQSHYHLRGWTTNLDNVRTALERYAATGAGISITELDITVGGYGSAPPNPEDLPALFEEQAQAYSRLFGYYLEFAHVIHRVSFWGLADSQSWRAPGHPLIFDAQFRAKPAFHAIVDRVINFAKLR